MKYVFDVKEISYGCIEVEAETKEQAKEMADEQYSMGNTVWKSGEYELTSETRQPPTQSPWGEIDNLEIICEGVYSVSTASHGGIMVERQTAEKVFSKQSQSVGFWENDYLCFEEDCAETVALRELMDKKLFKPHGDDYFSQGKYEDAINRTIVSYYPEYWKYHQSQTQPRDIDRGDER